MEKRQIVIRILKGQGGFPLASHKGVRLADELFQDLRRTLEGRNVRLELIYPPKPAAPSP
jgi:hypothetical protein